MIQFFFRNLTLFLVLKITAVNAQIISNSSMKLKEFFDAKVENATGMETDIVGNFLPPNISTLTTNFRNTTGADDLAEVNAPVMDAQLVLYETTKDKGYLINFINDALQMMSMRADYMQSRLGTYKYKII